MKKLIGILGIAVVASAMFLSTNAVNSSTEDTSISSLIALNTANAETAWGCRYNGSWYDYCGYIGTNVIRCAPSSSGGCYFY